MAIEIAKTTTRSDERHDVAGAGPQSQQLHLRAPFGFGAREELGRVGTVVEINEFRYRDACRIALGGIEHAERASGENDYPFGVELEQNVRAGEGKRDIAIAIDAQLGGDAFIVDGVGIAGHGALVLCSNEAGRGPHRMKFVREAEISSIFMTNCALP